MPPEPYDHLENAADSSRPDNQADKDVDNKDVPTDSLEKGRTRNVDSDTAIVPPPGLREYLRLPSSKREPSDEETPES